MHSKHHHARRSACSTSRNDHYSQTGGAFLVEVSGQISGAYTMAVVHKNHVVNSISLYNEDALTMEKVAIALAAVCSNSIFSSLRIPKESIETKCEVE
uniref:Tick transposon n=1 Tax=Rhipicephalus appendiculatus TaxID=34631 RepID=A0A131YDE3_RHIAP